jgi:non-ribosomal peptide synthetase component F
VGLTYADLDRRANQLAHYLASAGVDREHLVGLYLERSPAFIVAALAALKAGAAYLPLDPDSPAGRIAFMLRDSRASAVVTSENLRDRISSGLWQIVDVVGDAAEIRQQTALAPESEIHSEDLAYVILYIWLDRSAQGSGGQGGAHLRGPGPSCKSISTLPGVGRCGSGTSSALAPR